MSTAVLMGRCAACGSIEHDTEGHAAAKTRLTRDMRRSRRRRVVRAATISIKRWSQRDRALARLAAGDVDALPRRPRTRRECGAERPCPFVSCVHHLYLDVNEDTGAIRLNFPDLEPWELRETCALDVADEGGATLERAGALLNLTRERIRQIEGKVILRVTRPMLEATGESPLRRLPVLKRTGIEPTRRMKVRALVLGGVRIAEIAIREGKSQDAIQAVVTKLRAEGLLPESARSRAARRQAAAR